jgi:hypothetical protein
MCLLRSNDDELDFGFDLITFTEGTKEPASSLDERSEDQGQDGGQFNQNVEGRSGGILQWITDGITDNGSLVFFRTLLLGDTTVQKFAGFDVFLGIIPGTTSVGTGDSHLDTRDQSTGQQTSNSLRAEEETNTDGSKDDQTTGGDHFSEGSLSGDGDTSFIIGGNFTSDNLGVFLDLLSDFQDHFEGSTTDGLHGHGREGIRKHSTDQKTGEEEGISDIDVSDDISLLGFTVDDGEASGSGDESTIKGEGDQSSRSDGETFTDGSGSVTGSIQSISSVSNIFTEFGHFSNTTSVIRDGAISIDSQTNAQVGEHTEGSEGNTEKTEESVGDISGDGEEDDGVDARKVTEGETVDDVGGSTGLAGFSDFLDGLIVVGGIVFSEDTNDETNDQTRDGADEGVGDIEFIISDGGGAFRGEDDVLVSLEISTSLGSDIATDVNIQEGGNVQGEDKEDGGDDELISESLFNLFVFIDLHDVGTEDRASQTSKDGKSTQHEGIEKVGISVISAISGNSSLSISAQVKGGEISLAGGSSKDDQRSAGSFSERTEKIRSHTSDITDVVTDVISDGGGVLGGIFREILFDFTDEISTDISSLSVDTTTDSSEKSHSRTTETVTSNGFVEFINGNITIKGISSIVGGSQQDSSVDHDDGDEDEEGEGGKGETHNATSLVSNSESFRQRVLSSESGSVVGIDGDSHTNETTDDRGDSTEQEGKSSVESAIDTIDGELDKNEEDDAEDSHDLVFLEEESVSTSSDVFTDINHEIDFISSTFVGEGDVFTGSTFLKVDSLNLQEVKEGPQETDNTANVDDDDGKGD